MHRHLLLSAVAILILSGCTISNTPLLRGFIDESPMPKPTINIPPSEITAWLPYWDWDRAISSAQNTPKLQTISPFTFLLQDDGSIVNKHSLPLSTKTRFTIIPTISHDLIASRVTDILDDPQKTEAHLADLLLIAENFNGIELDYENLPINYRDPYTEFVQTLAEKLHQQDKTLALALHAKTNDVINQLGSGSLDYQQLCTAADLCRIMAYDYRYSGSEAGPVAPLYWLKEVIDYSQKNIPNNKLVLGLPLYGYAWDEPQKGISKTQTQIKTILAQPETQSKFDARAATPYLEYGNTQLWYDNVQSLQTKIDYARSKGIYQFAFWKLGQDESLLNELDFEKQLTPSEFNI